jgi:hypothetical protein
MLDSIANIWEMVGLIVNKKGWDKWQVSEVLQELVLH